MLLCLNVKNVYYSSELGVAGGLAVTAISYFVMPYCPSVWQLGVANVFHGIGYGIINSSKSSFFSCHNNFVKFAYVLIS